MLKTVSGIYSLSFTLRAVLITDIISMKNLNEIKKIDKLSLSPDPKNWYITQSTAKKKMLEGILCNKNYFVGRVKGGDKIDSTRKEVKIGEIVPFNDLSEDNKKIVQDH